MQQQIKVGSIIEIVHHDLDYIDPEDAKRFPVGTRHEVVAYWPDTGEVELWTAINDTVTFFPGEYKLVE